jgi:hypothetical protein
LDVLSWSRPKQPTHQQKSLKLVESELLIEEGEPISFYQLAMLLFPEVSSESPLDLEMLDTLFFLQDHSIHYVFKVAPQ